MKFIQIFDRRKNIYRTSFFFIFESIYSLWSIGNLWRASKRCDLQLSSWLHSMIFLCFLFHPLLSFATFSSACLFFYTPEDSNLMRFSLLILFLYVMCVQNVFLTCLYIIILHLCMIFINADAARLLQAQSDMAEWYLWCIVFKLYGLWSPTLSAEQRDESRKKIINLLRIL
jgi:hypothetical protein